MEHGVPTWERTPPIAERGVPTEGLMINQLNSYWVSLYSSVKVIAERRVSVWNVKGHLHQLI